MSTPKLNLYPITGINVYALPIPELVEQLQHATNDETYKGAGEEECQSTSNQSNQSNVSSSSHSDTPTVVVLHPIGKRYPNYK